MRYSLSWLAAAVSTVMVVSAPCAGIALADEAQPGTSPVTTQGVDDTADVPEASGSMTAQPGTTTISTPGSDGDGDSGGTTPAQPGTSPAEDAQAQDATTVTGAAQPGTEEAHHEDDPVDEQDGAADTQVAPADTPAAGGGESGSAGGGEPVGTNVPAQQPASEPQGQEAVPVSEETGQVRPVLRPVVMAPKGAIVGVQVRANLGEHRYVAVHDVATATTTVRADGRVSGVIAVSRDSDGVTLSAQDYKITVVPDVLVRANDAVGGVIAKATPREVHAVREGVLAHVPTDASVAVDGNEIAVHVDRV